MTYDLMPTLTALIIYLVLSGFATVFLYGIYRRLRAYFRRSQPRFDLVSHRVLRTLSNAFAQRKVMKRPFPGLMHLLIYAGMVVLLIGTTLVFLENDIWETFFHSKILVGSFYLFYELILDAFGLLAIAGLLIAIYRRTFSRPPNLPTSRDDVYIFSLLLTILFTGYLMEGIRLAVDKPLWAPWSFVGYQIARFLESRGFDGQTAISLYRGLWWFHALLAFAGVASIPYTKLFHIVTSPLNALFLHSRPVGQLSTPFDLRQLLETGNFDVKVGAASIADFSWQQRLSFDSCTSCGRCTNACPATASGTLLSPMHLVLKLRDVMLSNWKSESIGNLIGELVDPEELWACTTCRACVHECPVLIDHIDVIVDMRRHIVTEGKLDRGKKDLLMNLNNVANPYGLPQADRLKWAIGLDVKTVKEQPEFDVLYWVGCAGSYDPRNQKVSRSIVKILHAAKVPFAVLGNEERCSCEVARRIGEEGRFQQVALELVELFKRYNVKLVLTQCPHCLNTFKNEYPEFGAAFQIVHHSQFIDQLIRSGKLKVKEGAEKVVTFHDPCYLGRYSGTYDEPRKVISSLGPITLKEMPRSREDSFCCGGGGANFWYKIEQKRKASAIRFDEAQRLNPDILATACPFCTSMFEDALASKETPSSIALRDIAELVADLVESS